MDEVTIIIKTFDRRKSLIKLIKSIIKKYPNIKILIGDDSKKSCSKDALRRFKNNNIKIYDLPYDSGISYGRNFLINKVKTKYFVLCDDDFVFDSKTNLEKAISIIKEKHLDILGGYIRNYKTIKNIFDMFITFAQKILNYEIATNYIGTINEKAKTLYLNYKIHDFPEYIDTDIVLNFFIASTQTIKLKNQWDNDLKLQEHTAFFYKAKKNKLKIGFSNCFSVQHHPIQLKNYEKYRKRNYTKVFMKKNDILKIVATYDDKKRNNIVER